MIRVTISLAIPAFVIVSLLFVPALGDEKPVESVTMTESQVRELAEKALAGRHVIVRVYNNWQTDPHAYILISVPLSGLWVSFDAVREAFRGVSDSAVIVVSGRQQNDRAVAAVMADSVCAERYQKGKQFSIWPPRFGTR